MIRVLLADDHPVVRAGLAAVLALQADVEVVYQVDTARGAVAFCATTPVDVVLMDLRFGDRVDGIDATRSLRALPEPPQVLVLTTYDVETDVLAAVEAGAVGYLLKDADPADLAAGIRAAARGETSLAPSIAQRLVRRTLRPDTSLSPRELEVLGLVADGLSNQQIGERLFLSQATIKSHLVHVFGKLGVDSRTAAVASARASGMIR
ncbi:MULTISPECIES: response regulator transcription factor [unclassified Nocardioides]|uniref:response regulator transcription factor n=1 Tax=unclassified Nocardioides TaxID=2615069 RepID=UPI0006FB37C4|nr:MULTISPECIES: response regulator transcription factor [unclassified Nocardioides]KQY64431.1 LuxR family transcriptional regulator [Nocardioides sp. Root140]KQZ70342.1 LuxR family transcriptional regulator [Nocardioides sp. Root151]